MNSNVISKTMDMESTKKMTKPCGACPFSKKVTPGALGGSSVETYIGQAHGPFWLPCHKNSDFSDPDWKKDYSKQQCAGAAMFRANIDRSRLMVSSMLKLPKSELVFESHAAFLAHHENIPLDMAETCLSNDRLERLMRKELNIALKLDN